MSHCWAILALTILSAACDRKAPHAGEAPGAAPLFREAAESTGLRFQHFTGATGEYFMPEIMGAGVALFDYDGDGDLDVYLVQGALLNKRKTLSAALFPPPEGWRPGNRLFRNELVPQGRLRFTGVTETAGVGYVGYGMGVAVGDYDNDGDEDLYLTNFGPNVLFRNNGDGTFTDVTAQAGVDDPRWSTSAAFFDYDRDGDLDLFVANYLDFTVKGNKPCFRSTGERDYCTPRAYRPVPAKLFRNEGGGKFRDVTQAAGVGSALGPGLGVLCADANEDGWLDIFVANDTAPNHLWINQGNGMFREEALIRGAAYAADGLARAGMGVALGDFDRDADEDLVVTNLAKESCTLFRNAGKGEFFDATLEFGLAAPTFPFTGFGVGWFDYDNDGWLDLFMAHGAVTMMESLRGTSYPFRQKNLLFRNEGGLKFRDVTTAAGPAFELSEVSRATAFGDLDNDGDVDLVVTNNNGPVRLLLNETGSGHPWLQVRLVGTQVNRQGLGARVAVLCRGQKPLWRRVHMDASYLSASDVRVHFGLADTPVVDEVVVQWPDGSRESWGQITASSFVTLRQDTGRTLVTAAARLGGK